MRPVFLSLCALCLWFRVEPVLANGGGYAFGVTFTGSLTPFQASGTKNVQILEEKLDITLRRTDASVVVRYTMKNLAEKPIRVRFGFPVEAIREDDFEEEDPDHPDTRPKGLLGAIQQLKGYTVTANGGRVKSVFEIEPFAKGKIKPFPGSEALKDIAGWMVSELVFPTGAPLLLEIRYSADYQGNSTFVSDDSNTTPLSFVYRLSTGAIWNGPITKGTVTVKADGIPAEEVDITAPLERFQRIGNQWIWSFQDLKPTLADDITIQASPGFSEVGNYGPDKPDHHYQSFLTRNEKWGGGHQYFLARASSTLKPAKDHNFEAKHLTELAPVAPWAEGASGSGIGEWIELEPSTPHPLLAIAIWPGFQSFKYPARPELFEKNGRPARLEITLNGERHFTATLGDTRGHQLIPLVGYTKPISKLRITIQEVYPGTRFADTCITKVVLYDLLDEPPQIRHAR